VNKEKSAFFSLDSLTSNAKIVSFVLCFFIASGIWVVNTLNKEHVAETSIRIRLNVPLAFKEDAGKADIVATVQLKGRGFDLADFLLFRSEEELIINSSTKNKGKISVTKAVESLLKPFGNKLTVENVNPEYLTLPNGMAYTKKVALIPTYSISYKKMFMQSGPAVTYPDSILISSSSPISSTLTSIKTLPIEQSNADRPVFHSTLPDITDNSNLVAEQTKVWVYVPVEIGTEIKLNVPVSSQESDRYLKFIPSFVSISCRVPISRFEETSASMFKVDAQLNKNGSSKAIIRVIEKPYWADQLKWTPAVVDYFHQNP